MVDANYFTVQLSSNASLDTYPTNTLASFRTSLSDALEFTGNWGVSLVDISYPRQVVNIDEGRFDFYWASTEHWYPNCTMQKGSYDTIHDVINEMHQAIHRARHVNESTVPNYFSYFIDARSVLIFKEPKNRHVRMRNLSEDLKFILGTHWEKSAYSPTLGVDHPHYPIDINRFHEVFVYCDCIEPQFVGNAKAPLLRSFPLFDTQQLPPMEVERQKGGVLGYGVTNHRVFPREQLRKLSKNRISEIQIELRSETGRLIPFTGNGRTNLALHFQKL